MIEHGRRTRMLPSHHESAALKQKTSDFWHKSGFVTARAARHNIPIMTIKFRLILNKLKDKNLNQ